MIANNSSSSLAGGIYVENAMPILMNNTVIGNGVTGNGEGILVGARSAPTITNNIVIDNGYGIVFAGELDDEELGLVSHNDVWNNHSGEIVGHDADGNMSFDPLFVRGRDGACYLSQIAGGQALNSQAVDAGTAPATDLGLSDRTTAVYDNPDEGIVDLGYHYRALAHKIYLPAIVGDRP